MSEYNIILNTDSYKPSHYLQYPPNTQYIYDYIESRGSAGDQNIYKDNRFALPMEETVFSGIQGFLQEYLVKGVTAENVERAAEVFKLHGVPFNREGWEYILKQYGGRLPLRIDAVPEGLVLPTKNALVTVVNTDPKVAWLVSYIETALLRAIWYPTTVATISRRIKKIIAEFLLETVGNTDGIDYMLHDFGSRGVSSRESSAIGGAAHLINFLGTDNLEAIMWVREHYNETMAGFSIPAAEHSSITTWGKEGEADAYRNMLQFANPGSMVAIVIDSYDPIRAIRDIWGGELKQEVIDSGATIILRPDSGDPISTVIQVLNATAEAFGVTENYKGYKELKYVKVIQGDGIDEKSIRGILEAMKLNKFAANNIAFGMGGALLQHMNRDTLKFAMKTSAAQIDGKWIDVYKDPITDPGKASKRGKVVAVRNVKSKFIYTTNTPEHPALEKIMKTVFVNGDIMNETTFAEVRKNAAI